MHQFTTKVGMCAPSNFVTMKASLFDADAAVKSLLRNMHEPKVLRVNPLVEHFFDARTEDGRQIDAEDALELVREAVTSTIKRVFVDAGIGRARVHLGRQREIVLRCHIGGESDKVVQAALGLERRQFYREKHRARVRLGKALQALVPGRLTSDVACTDVRELSLAHFRALREAGDAAAAIRLAKPLWLDTQQWQHKIELGALLAGCYAENAAWAEADDLLRAMQREQNTDARSRALLAWAQGQRAWFSGTFASSVAHSEETIHHLGDPSVRRDARDDEFLCLSYLQLAHSRHMLGEYESALSALQSAREIAENRPSLPSRVTVNVLYHLGGVLSAIPGCAEAAERHLQEGYSIATRGGLIRDASEIALSLAQVYDTMGEVDRALEFGREALAVSQRVRGAAEHGWHRLSFACVELSAGNAARALELTRTGGGDVTIEPARVAYGRSIEAEALLRLGDARAALQLSSQAAMMLSAPGQPRGLRARALRVYSEAAYHAGERFIAHNAMEESMELHQGLRNPRGLVSALRVSAAITGDVRYERNARELLHSLRRQ